MLMILVDMDINGTVSGAYLVEDRFGYSQNAYGFDGIDDEISISMTDLLEGVTSSDHSFSVPAPSIIIKRNSLDSLKYNRLLIWG